ncbi:DUF4158 domain-containing protein [Paenibacillus popilliae]|uniref:DUF4158 domain-containing protein n=1 Tax=Paenibacillus popilliae TaxID=78057 RepID=UPI0002E85685|nr:DUF4158 domain-containing protein [Paenibacillus popilliae]
MFFYFQKVSHFNPEERLQYLHIPPDLGEREATKYEHLEEIRKEYGYQTFTLSEYRS